jgi:hypothetical protein
LSRAQKLSRALRACRRDKRHKQRTVCKRQARARFGPVKSRGGKAIEKGKR